MRFSTLAYGLMLLVGLPATPALSVSIPFEVPVKSGVRAFLGAHFALDPSTCRPDEPTIQVIVQPSHGKLTTGRSSKVLPGTVMCSGIKAGKIDLYYKSTPNFHGTDTIQIKVERENRKPAGTYVYTIIVK